jgi:hypothetical protein
MMMHKPSVYAHIGNGFYVVLLLRNLLRVAMNVFVVSSVFAFVSTD